VKKLKFGAWFWDLKMELRNFRVRVCLEELLKKKEKEMGRMRVSSPKRD